MTEIEIKKLLVKHFLEKYDDFVVSSEFTFQFGERRADLALLHIDMLTAYEIKGDRDTLSRLSYQVDSYKQFFDFCFVVCESKNLAMIREILPKEVGILLAEPNGITHVRKAKHYKRHDKLILSSVLSVQKLSSIARCRNLKSKQELCQYVSKNNTIDFLRKLSRIDFRERYGVASKLMKQETTLHLTSDDIYTITKKAPSLLKKRIN